MYAWDIDLASLYNFSITFLYLFYNKLTKCTFNLILSLSLVVFISWFFSEQWLARHIIVSLDKKEMKKMPTVPMLIISGSDILIILNFLICSFYFWLAIEWNIHKGGNEWFARNNVYSWKNEEEMTPIQI